MKMRERLAALALAGLLLAVMVMTVGAAAGTANVYGACGGSGAA